MRTTKEKDLEQQLVSMGHGFMRISGGSRDNGIWSQVVVLDPRCRSTEGSVRFGANAIFWIADGMVSMIRMAMVLVKGRAPCRSVIVYMVEQGIFNNNPSRCLLCANLAVAEEKRPIQVECPPGSDLGISGRGYW